MGEVEALSQAQRRVYDYVRDYVDHHRQPPTLREICKALGLRSTNAVAEHLDTLVTKGVLVRIGKNMARAVTLPPVVKPRPKSNGPWVVITRADAAEIQQMFGARLKQSDWLHLNRGAEGGLTSSTWSIDDKPAVAKVSDREGVEYRINPDHPDMQQWLPKEARHG